jgi:uroporphyrinogen-III synthase
MMPIERTTEVAAASECYDLSMAPNLASEQGRTAGSFGGRTVLSFESRRSAEIATLIENCGGRALVAPATREVPAAGSADVSRFASALLEAKLDLVIFLTGVGTRALARAIEPFCSREKFVSSLSKVPVLARGPKPIAALKELGVPIVWNVPEPNTWREILQVLDVNQVPLEGRRVAVQEYGIPSKDLVQGLQERGAEVLAVHVYDWALPEEITPLRNAIEALIANRVDVVLFTAAVQVHHLLQVAEEMSSKDSLLAALGKIKIASIGPVTSEALAEYGIRATLEPTHPKMGLLVREAAAFEMQ